MTLMKRARLGRILTDTILPKEAAERLDGVRDENCLSLGLAGDEWFVLYVEREKDDVLGRIKNEYDACSFLLGKTVPAPVYEPRSSFSSFSDT
jgi:hypothetical protein